MLDTHGIVEQHDAGTYEKQRRDADASADRWSVATARVRDIGTVLRHCATALDGVAPDICQTIIKKSPGGIEPTTTKTATTDKHGQ